MQRSLARQVADFDDVAVELVLFAHPAHVRRSDPSTCDTARVLYTAICPHSFLKSIPAHQR